MRSKKLVIGLLIAVGFVGFVTVIAVRRGGASQLEPMPNPNGYTGLIAGAALLAGPIGDWNTLPADDLAALVATNAAALRRVRAGLDQECRVPPYSLNASNGSHLNDLANLKRVAHAFCAEGRLARLENRPGDALRAALDCLHLGRQGTTGGVMIDALVGIAIQAIALNQLQQWSGSLDAQGAKQVVQALIAAEAGTEPAEVVLAREHRWMRQGRFGPASLLTLIYEPFLTSKAKAAFQRKEEAITRQRRQALIQFAARAFEAEHGRRPASVGELVPGFLPVAPRDPATGKEMGLN